jgi:hypothetical protein
MKSMKDLLGNLASIPTPLRGSPGRLVGPSLCKAVNRKL